MVKLSSALVSVSYCLFYQQMRREYFLFFVSYQLSYDHLYSIRHKGQKKLTDILERDQNLIIRLQDIGTRVRHKKVLIKGSLSFVGSLS